MKSKKVEEKNANKGPMSKKGRKKPETHTSQTRRTKGKKELK
ncbi:hypothetical protein A2U01_0116567, partial [Trifolium medium]|nr:hypothetical protein [Trifolium medium]